jgi:hypothetical protein
MLNEDKEELKIDDEIVEKFIRTFHGSDLPTRWAISLARRQQAARRAAYRKQKCEIYDETTNI